MIDTVVDGIVISDAQGHIQLFNGGCERLFGYRSDEVIGRNIKMLMPDPYTAEHDNHLSRFRETGERRIIGVGRNVWGQRADRSVFPMYLSVGEIRQEDGGQMFVGVIRDTTEQHALERTLREQAERLQSILETVPDAIIVIDEKGLIESFSPAAERLFGWSASEVNGQNVSMLMPAPYGQEHDGYMDRYRRTGERKIIGIGRVVVGRRRDGSTFPMELEIGGSERLDRSGIHRIRPRPDGEPEGKTAGCRSCRQNWFTSHGFRIWGKWASALAHELNQPLTAIINWMQAARRLIAIHIPEQSSKAITFVDNAIEQANRAGQIIRRLRGFLERGDAERQAEDINRVVEEATAPGAGGRQRGWSSRGVQFIFATASRLDRQGSGSAGRH